VAIGISAATEPPTIPITRVRTSSTRIEGEFHMQRTPEMTARARRSGGRREGSFARRQRDNTKTRGR
jgi:hypothetical protein